MTLKLGMGRCLFGFQKIALESLLHSSTLLFLGSISDGNGARDLSSKQTRLEQTAHVSMGP